MNNKLPEQIKEYQLLQLLQLLHQLLHLLQLIQTLKDHPQVIKNIFCNNLDQCKIKRLIIFIGENRNNNDDNSNNIPEPNYFNESFTEFMEAAGVIEGIDKRIPSK